MNQSVFKTLEYAKIITMLQNMATSSMGKELAEKLLPSSDIDEVIENLSHTQEASNILISSEPPFGGIHDIRSLLKKTSLGLVIEINSLLDILNTMYAMRNLKKFFKELEIDSPQFKEWAKSIEILGQLEREIDNIVDEHGSMRDSASVELMRIRREIKSSQRRIKTNLDGILKILIIKNIFKIISLLSVMNAMLSLSNKNIVNNSQVSYMTNPLVVLLCLLNLCPLLT